MKVLYFLQDKDFFSRRSNVVGGHIAHIIGVIEAFQRLGHEVIIASYDEVPYWHNSKVRYHLFDISEFPIPKVRSPIRFYQLTNQIIDLIEKEKPDILYVRWATNLFFGRVARVFPTLPIVVECNTPSEMFLGERYVPLWRRWIAHIADKQYVNSAMLISAVSKEVRSFLLEHHPRLEKERVIVNPNGVDVEKFQPLQTNVRYRYGIPEQAIVIGYSGNFCPWHRIDLLIHAVQRLDREYVYLMVIGTGPIELEKSLRSLAATQRSSQVIFIDPIPFGQMPEYFSACDILVSSQSATVSGKLHQSPIKLYEYMAMGRAVVGSRIGQIARVIDHGRNGLLFRPDSVDSLVSVLNRLIGNSELRASLGRNARYDAEQFYSWEANVERILDALVLTQHK